ncbi:heat shock [Musa troglodytarum]|uniref:Heat shock n=1 Tax=Musa troglodytarum TaxID=320322 RepID=A0A9E7F465_9LILI|nr:heat shock [Musa troglodytarum]
MASLVSPGSGLNLPRSNAFGPISVDVWHPLDGVPFGSSSLLPFPRPPSALLSEASALISTLVDWKETPEAHVFIADLPGLKKEEVKVDVEGGRILQISGKKRDDEEDKTGTWHRVERTGGCFLRRFLLPDNAKAEQARAAMADGVLTVTVPKEDVNKAHVKSIKISG